MNKPFRLNAKQVFELEILLDAQCNWPEHSLEDFDEDFDGYIGELYDSLEKQIVMKDWESKENDGEDGVYHFVKKTDSNEFKAVIIENDSFPTKWECWDVSGGDYDEIGWDKNEIKEYKSILKIIKGE